MRDEGKCPQSRVRLLRGGALQDDHGGGYIGAEMDLAEHPRLDEFPGPCRLSAEVGVELLFRHSGDFLLECDELHCRVFV